MGKSSLAYVTSDGIGTATNMEKCVKLFEEAAKAKSEYGQVLLGLCFLHGQGVEKDLVHALKLFRHGLNQ